MCIYKLYIHVYIIIYKYIYIYIIYIHMVLPSNFERMKLQAIILGNQ